MNILTQHPLLIGSLIPLLAFFMIYSLSHLNDDRTNRYAMQESTPSIQADSTSGTQMPRDSFVRFEQVFVDSLTRKESIIGMGSGVVIKQTKNGSYILTNNHVCHISAETIVRMALSGKVGSIKNMVKSLDGERANVIILKKDPKTDMCAVFAKNFYRPAVEVAPFAPDIGETIYVVGAPRGYYSPKFSTVPILSGIFSGYDVHWADKSVTTGLYTIRIAPGNSGSPILNQYGQLVGVVHSHFTIFDEITWGTTHKDTKDFIKIYRKLK